MPNRLSNCAKQNIVIRTFTNKEVINAGYQYIGYHLNYSSNLYKDKVHAYIFILPSPTKKLNKLTNLYNTTFTLCELKTLH